MMSLNMEVGRYLSHIIVVYFQHADTVAMNVLKNISSQMVKWALCSGGILANEVYPTCDFIANWK